MEEEIDVLMLSNSQLKASKIWDIFEERLTITFKFSFSRLNRLTTDFLSGYEVLGLLTMDLNDKAISENIGSFPGCKYSVNFAKAIF